MMRVCHCLLCVLLIMAPGAWAGSSSEKMGEGSAETSREGSDSPFRITLFDPVDGEDGERLWSQTKLLFGLGLALPLVGEAVVPNDKFEWNITDGDPLGRWWDHVSHGPKWDHDDSLINYLGHPYFGGVYYQVARKSGYDQWNSFVYTALMSTFYWEYGVEAFTEPPSIQDLIVTPLGGWLYGEWAFQKEKQIRQRGGTVFNSKWLGSTALFFLDPVDSIASGINRMVGKEVFRAGSLLVSRRAAPGADASDAYLTVTLVLGF